MSKEKVQSQTARDEIYICITIQDVEPISDTYTVDGWSEPIKQHF